MFYIDAHCDSVAPMSKTPHLDLNRCRITESGIQFMACFAPEFERVSDMLDILEPADAVLSARDVGDDRWRILKSVEGGDCLFDGTEQCAFERLDILYGRGVRSLGLTWNNPNPLSGGTDTPALGLTALGYDIIGRCEELGIVVDLAHISQTGFYDALNAARKPVIVSHTAAASLHTHPRNLTDAQIRAVGERGGVIGICLYPLFLGGTDISLILRHIEHIRNTGGSECAGIGTDFDGIPELPDGIEGVEDMLRILERVDDKVRGANFARVLKECL